MALEYRLTLAGDTPIEQIAARALPDPAERPTPYENILTVDLHEQHGFDVTVAAARNRFYEADSGTWEWELPTAVNITFRLDKDPEQIDPGVRSMLQIVNRVLRSGAEDAALILNGDHLLLARVDGVVHKHRRAGWWDRYGVADTVD